MNTDEILKQIPREGFLKVADTENRALSAAQRTALIRKGNQLFNAGNIEQAKRVFLTTGYGDGLTRVGDHYAKRNRPLDALRMYWLAPAPHKIERMTEQISSILAYWLAEGKGVAEDEERTDIHDGFD